MSQEKLELGVRFIPTDEVLINHFLMPKIREANPKDDRRIAEVDFYNFEPWDLPSESKVESEDMWFFFCKPEKYHSRGLRRKTGIGFWKVTGKVQKINDHETKKHIGNKKTLVFQIKKDSATPREGDKWKWVMQEYSVEPDNQESFVVCRLKKKPNDKLFVSEVENHETPAAFPQNSLQAHGEVSTRSFIASGEQEESPDEIMNQHMADLDSQSYGETSYHRYTTLQSASSPRQRSGDGLLGSDMNTEGVIQQDSFQAQGDEEVIQGLRLQPLYSPVREEMPYCGYAYGGVVDMRSFAQSATTTEEPQINPPLRPVRMMACFSGFASGGSINRLDLDAEEHLEYVTAGRRRGQELQASFSSTETPPNEVGEEAEMRNSNLPSEYRALVLLLIKILFTTFALLVYDAWKLVRHLSRERRPFVVLCCAVSFYFLFFRNTSVVSHQHKVVSNPAAHMLPE